MADLTLNLKAEYFDAIANGSKQFEYREIKPFWTKRLSGRDYDNLIICKGYPSKDDHLRRLVFPYIGYETKTITHKIFGNKPTAVYAIKIFRKERS